MKGKNKKLNRQHEIKKSFGSEKPAVISRSYLSVIYL
jgi:hypothetical protein